MTRETTRLEAESALAERAGRQIVQLRARPRVWCTLTASQPGDTNFEPAADVSQSFDVSFDFSGFRPLHLSV